MVNQRLTWSQIKEIYKYEWVELVDFKWDWNKARPSYARVRHNAPHREELISQVRKAGEVQDSIILYLGVADAVIEHDSAVAIC